MTDHMDPSKYFVVSIREYDEMKAEIERLRARILLREPRRIEAHNERIP